MNLPDLKPGDKVLVLGAGCGRAAKQIGVIVRRTRKTLRVAFRGRNDVAYYKTTGLSFFYPKDGRIVPLEDKDTSKVEPLGQGD